METETTKLINKSRDLTSTGYSATPKQLTTQDVQDKKYLSSSTSRYGLLFLLTSLVSLFLFLNYGKQSSTLKSNYDTGSNSNDDSVDRPNIIFIMMDDMGFSDISLRGSEFSTPKLDYLYSNSIVINNYYIGLLCSPSRSQMLSGRYAWNFGLSSQTAFSSEQLVAFPTGLPLLSELLNKYTNYDPYIVGKWQLGYSTTQHLPLSRGWKEFYGFYGGKIDYETKECQHYMDWRDNEDVDYDTKDTFSTFVTADKVNQIVKQHNTDNSNNFFIYTAFQAVHSTMVSIESENSNNCDVIETEIDSDGLVEYSKYMESLIEDDIDDYISTDESADRLLLCENVMAVDQAIGEITDTLKENNLWDNTLIVMVSDNGGALNEGSCNYPLRGGKKTYFEGGVRTFSYLTGGYVTSLKENKKYANSQNIDSQRYYNKNSYLKGFGINLHASVDHIDSDSYDIDVRSSFMHGADWTPTILTIAGADVDTISNDLQNNLYMPVAKEISLSKKGTEDDYENYLMDTSFDGVDLSEWLFFGDKDKNTRVDVPLSINVKSTEDEGSNDNALIFTSSITGNVYKLMSLSKDINPDDRNCKVCDFVLGSNAIDYQRDVYKKHFRPSSKLIFDLTLDSSETRSLIEITTSNNSNSSTAIDQDILKSFKLHADDDNIEYILNENIEIEKLEDYDYDLVLKLWNEGISVMESFTDNVLFNRELSCQFAVLSDDADPSTIGDGDAWAPFYEWDDYLNQFDNLCGQDINDVLYRFYQIEYKDYM